MATLTDILNDKQRPDDQKVVVEGVEVTLGELRKMTMQQSDYTRKTMDLAKERKKLEDEHAEWEFARLDAEAKLTDLAKQVMQQHPGVTRDEVDDLLERDPLAKRLMGKLEEVSTELVTLKDKTAKQDELLQRQQLAWYEDQHRRMLAKIKNDDPDVDVDALVNWAREHYTPRLDVAYKAMKFEDKVAEATKKARKEGLEEGIKKAKAELSQPVIPSRRVLSPLPDAPKNFDEAVDKALQDPEIMATFGG